MSNATGVIRNPVLPGFHPDPSILRVGADYYIATSTFEWYPGVRLHHSRDLVNWRALGGALAERRLVDLAGTPDSGGVWAPCLSYAHGLFHLVYTDMNSHGGGYWDAQNHLTTAPEITGPWSDPVRLHARGFDPSMFHDADGTSWMLSMTADWRPGRAAFAGIQAQRFDRASGRLTGPAETIFAGTAAGVTEAPHLYRKDGWYYLVTAEGGTSYEHQVTVARARTVTGPYEPDPRGPLLTSYGHPELALQKAGHGSLVETPGGWYLAHLVGRPYPPHGRCVLGRETAIQPVTWDGDGWPRIGGGVPAVEVPGPGLPAHPFPAPPERDDFDAPVLGPQWSTLRRPAGPEWLSLSARPSHLRIFGGQSPRGTQRPALVARRVTDRRCAFETVVDAEPASFRQLAGVAAYYNTRNWHFAHLTRTDDGLRVLDVLTGDDGVLVRHPAARVDVTGTGPVGLAADLDGPVLRFRYDTGEGWRTLPVELDATILSDEYALVPGPDGVPETWGFTGAFVGLWVQDLGADRGYADFAHARYVGG
ncbi:MAG TPA: glycoside hydrolase family 43 protein [Streptosporangiaceae bacterium]|jgi:xylan 1,4-beta-xylosidase